MAGQQFPLPKNSTPGSLPGEGEGRYWNCAPVTEGERSYIRPTPGLDRQVSTGKTGIRGMIDVNDVLYVVWSDSVVTIDGDTVTTLTGSIPGSAGVTMARNNRVTDGASTPDVVAVRSEGGAYVLTSSAVEAYPDADLPDTANSVVFVDGFLVFSIPDGRIFASELNSTDVNALSFATAEARADGLLRLVVRGAIVYAMGGSTIEPWKNEGLSPFPLLRQATVMQVGLHATMAVAGYEDSWNAPTFFVSADKQVSALVGFETSSVSTADVNRFISASTPSTIDVTAYVWEGRSYVAISSDQGTWVFDVSGASWHERGSTGATRWRAKYSTYSGNSWVFGDALTGDLLVMSSAFTENGEPIGGFIQTGALVDFPANVAAKLVANFSPADVTIYVSWSHDGGKSWCADEIPLSIEHADQWPLSIASLGRSTHHGIIVKFRWAATGAFSFMGAAATRADARQG